MKVEHVSHGIYQLSRAQAAELCHEARNARQIGNGALPKRDAMKILMPSKLKAVELSDARDASVARYAFISRIRMRSGLAWCLELGF